MRIQEIMTTDVHSIESSATLARARELMKARGIRHLVVRRDGRPAANVNVMVYGKGNGRATTDETGRFEVADVKPGECHLQVSAGGERSFSSVHDQVLTLQSGEVREVTIELHWVDVTLVVRDADGSYVKGANVNGSRANAKGGEDHEDSGRNFVWQQTDGEGRATVAIAKEGPWVFNVQSEEHGTAHARVDVPSGGLDHPIEVTLDPGVRCAGRVEFDGAAPPEEGNWWMGIEAAGDGKGDVDTTSEEVDPKTRKFEVKGLKSGTYRASLYVRDGGQFHSQTFTLPSHGDTNLVLRFSRQ